MTTIQQNAYDQLTEIERGLRNQTNDVWRYIHELEDCGWIPVRERLPEDGEWVMAWTRRHGCETVKYISEMWAFPNTVSHWRPLTPLPEDLK